MHQRYIDLYQSWDVYILQTWSKTKSPKQTSAQGLYQTCKILSNRSGAGEPHTFTFKVIPSIVPHARGSSQSIVKAEDDSEAKHEQACYQGLGIDFHMHWNSISDTNNLIFLMHLGIWAQGVPHKVSCYYVLAISNGYRWESVIVTLKQLQS